MDVRPRFVLLPANRQLTIFHGGTRSPFFRFFPSFSSTLDSSELLRREPSGEPPSCSSSRKDGRSPLEASRGAVDSTAVSSIGVASENRSHGRQGGRSSIYTLSGITQYREVPTCVPVCWKVQNVTNVTYDETQITTRLQLIRAFATCTLYANREHDRFVPYNSTRQCHSSLTTAYFSGSFCTHLYAAINWSSKGGE